MLLKKLPDELIGKICEEVGLAVLEEKPLERRPFVKFCYCWYDAGSHTSAQIAREEPGTLKALRLVCRKLAVISKQYLFGQLCFVLNTREPEPGLQRLRDASVALAGVDVCRSLTLRFVRSKEFQACPLHVKVEKIGDPEDIHARVKETRALTEEFVRLAGAPSTFPSVTKLKFDIEWSHYGINIMDPRHAFDHDRDSDFEADSDDDTNDDDEDDGDDVDGAESEEEDIDGNDMGENHATNGADATGTDADETNGDPEWMRTGEGMPNERALFDFGYFHTNFWEAMLVAACGVNIPEVRHGYKMNKFLHDPDHKMENRGFGDVEDEYEPGYRRKDEPKAKFTHLDLSFWGGETMLPFRPGGALHHLTWQLEELNLHWVKAETYYNGWRQMYSPLPFTNLKRLSITPSSMSRKKNEPHSYDRWSVVERLDDKDSIENGILNSCATLEEIEIDGMRLDYQNWEKIFDILRLECPNLVKVNLKFLDYNRRKHDAFKNRVEDVREGRRVRPCWKLRRGIMSPFFEDLYAYDKLMHTVRERQIAKGWCRPEPTFRHPGSYEHVEDWLKFLVKPAMSDEAVDLVLHGHVQDWKSFLLSQDLLEPVGYRWIDFFFWMGMPLPDREDEHPDVVFEYCNGDYDDEEMTMDDDFIVDDD